MKNLIPRVVACLIVLVAPSATSVARADLLSAFEASALIQSTASDTDVRLLSQFALFRPGRALDYSSTSTTTAWTGTLSGSPLGAALNVAYSGDLSNYPSGAITWTSTGTFGGASWSGSGAATITDTSSTTFQVSFASSLAIGSNTASINYVIPGTVLADGTNMFGDPSHGEVGTGTVTLDGVLYSDLILFSYRMEGGFGPDSPRRLVISDIFGVPIHGGVDLLNKNVVIPIPFTSMFSMTGTVTSVPEPSSLLLLTCGLLGWFSFHRCTRGGGGMTYN
jgi:hypothetical protein